MLYARYIGSLLLIIIASAAVAQTKPTYHDGPYIAYRGDSLDVMWIADGVVQQERASSLAPYTFTRPKLPTVTVRTSHDREPYKEYTASKYVAISDIHGQYSVFDQLLKSHNIVDSAGSWAYGDGHLIIVGDMLDRGDQVTEVLWKLYQLEEEARLAGGKVHILLGNHELMVMEGNIGYIHVKYRFTSGASQVPYPQLFGKSTVLGQWLRSKPISVKVNNTVFVHGGFSTKVLKQENSLEKINEVFAAKVIDQNVGESTAHNLPSLLYFENGPLWYRGYADPRGFDEATAQEILTALQADAIVVGHTSMPRIVSILDDRIILIDSSIKFGKSGELLIYEKGDLFRGMMDGSRLQLGIKANSQDVKSPFEYVHELADTDLTIILDTDLKKLFGKNREKKKYQEATLTAIHNLEFNRQWDIRLKTRGNMRKKTCRIPPLKIDFSKTALDYLGFTANDKLKLVMPCEDRGYYQQAVYREHILYQLYQVVDSLGLRSHLVDVILENKGKEKYSFTGFFLEDETDFASRTGAQVIEQGIIRDEAIDRGAYLRMMFFQFMILNTDFGIQNKHNVEIVKMPSKKRVIALPYDFDYAGIINNDYAVPHESLPQETVRDPLFRGKEVTIEEVRAMQVYFESIRPQMEKIITDALYLTKSSKRWMLKDIESFYSALANENHWKNTFVNP